MRITVSYQKYNSGTATAVWVRKTFEDINSSFDLLKALEELGIPFTMSAA